MTNFVAHIIPPKDREELHEVKGNDCRCRPDRSAVNKVDDTNTLQVFEHKTIRGFRRYIPWLNWDRVGLSIMSAFVGIWIYRGVVNDGFFSHILGLLWPF